MCADAVITLCKAIEELLKLLLFLLLLFILFIYILFFKYDSCEYDMGFDFFHPSLTFSFYGLYNMPILATQKSISIWIRACRMWLRRLKHH